ncbi:Homoserine kinase [Alphaproteobacteria bacterium SO-S41]|nr:Homoserine kinase [Alphaproteobacteria bacterium SO-S41]
MAVYTDIDDEELAAFLSDYDIGPALAFKGIAEGVENSNFFLQTASGRFILTLYEKRVAEGDLPFFLGLLDHLATRGVNCPRPLQGRDGAAVRRLAGRPAAIFTFLDGMWPRRPAAAHCGEAGETAARLHAATAGFAIRRENALSLAGWPKLVASCTPKADTVSPGLAKLISDELAFLQDAWPQGLPEGVIHADMFPDNTLFVGPKLTGVIDFYFACNDTFAYDLAVNLNAWCFEGDGSFNLTKGRTMLARYQAARPLSAEEIAALPVLARGSALRFLLTRLHDWINRDPAALVRPKDPLECLGWLRFHQHVTSAGDYGV